MNNNNICDEETDSDTSTPETTTIEETMSLCDETEIMESILKEKIIKPIKTYSFMRYNTTEEINDNFELSILRLLHLIFSKDNLINLDNLSKFMDMNNKECDELLNFFIDYPGVFNEPDYYYTETGIKMRTIWFDLLSNRTFFNYKCQGKEIKPTMSNFLSFFRNFLPKLEQTEENKQELLTNIYNQLNFNFESFEVIYSTYQEILLLNIHISTIQNIIINGIDIFTIEMTELKSISKEKVIDIYEDCELRYTKN